MRAIYINRAEFLDSMEYKELLKRGREGLPESVLKHERFEIPKVRGHIQGNKTIISNFHQIASVLRRAPEHVQKYVLKELAAPGDLTKTALIIGRKTSAVSVNDKINKYANEFVICSVCNKPDTKIERTGSISSLQCLACGAKRPIRSNI